MGDGSTQGSRLIIVIKIVERIIWNKVRKVTWIAQIFQHYITSRREFSTPSNIEYINFYNKNTLKIEIHSFSIHPNCTYKETLHYLV